MARAEPAAAAPGPARDGNRAGHRCGARRMLGRERMRANVRVLTRESGVRSRPPFAARSDGEQPPPAASPSHGREGARVGWAGSAGPASPCPWPGPAPASPCPWPCPVPVLPLPSPGPSSCPAPVLEEQPPPLPPLGLGTAFPAPIENGQTATINPPILSNLGRK